jgi:hypothetical protein
VQISKRLSFQVHPGKKQQKSRCFKLLKGTHNFLRRYFIAANLNLYNTSRVVESLSLEGACLRSQKMWRVAWTPDYFSTAGAAGAGSMRSERGMILAGQRTLSVTVQTAYDEDLWC